MTVSKQQNILEMVFDEHPGAVLILDPNGRVKLFNKQAEHSLGWVRDGATRHDFRDALSGITPEQGTRLLEQTRVEGTTTFEAMVRAKEDIRPCTAIIRHFGETTAEEWFACYLLPVRNDVGQGHQAQYEILAQRLSRRDDIMQAISVGAARYLEVDDVGTSAPYLLNQTAAAARVSRAYVFCNHNLGKEELGATRIIEFIGEEGKKGEHPATISYKFEEFAQWAKTLSNGEVLLLVQQQIEDSPFWQSPSLSAILLPIFAHGEWWGFMGFEDNGHERSWESERDALKIVAGLFGLAVEREYEKNRRQHHEAELAHHSRLSIVGEMASGMAHELNQPLAAIVNYCQVALNLLEQEQSIERLRDTLEKTAHQAKRSADIISRIRNFARKDEASIEKIGINQVIRNVLEFANHKIASQRTDVQVSLLSEDQLISVCVVQIEQVILNLLLNALDSVADSDAHNNQVALAVRLEGKHVVVSVQDNGAGISEVLRDKIFEPFESSKKDGLGMGLTISRTIIEAHDGKLDVESEIGQGARFYFSLPVAAA